MPIRRQVRTTLQRAIGKERTDQIRRMERDLRRKAAVALDPSPRPTSRPKPAGSKPASAPSKPAAPTPPSPAEKPSSEKTPGELASRPPGGYQPSDANADFPTPERSRHQVLKYLHETLSPQTYLETGIADGASLTLSRCRSIGVDPAYRIDKELLCDVQLVRDTSDAFFDREDPVAHFGGAPVDLAFVDGMHLAEFALRDFMNVERVMARTGVILVDDMLPRNHLEAARDRRTKAWTGDVFKLLLILQEQRPDLLIVALNTSPTGTVLITRLDPSSTVLTDNYDKNLEFCLSPDPQDVPDRLLRRLDSLHDITSSVWSELAGLRGSEDATALADVFDRLLQAK
ncbi:MAG: class I SAM-dependent methyltransferase [Propionibacteriaceae bacterium]